MDIEITKMEEKDIPEAVKVVQAAFSEDPYNRWVFDHQKFDFNRNAATLGIRMKWGISNGIFHVAKEANSERVLGVAMWLPPRPANEPSTWTDFFEGWRLYLNQIAINLYYGRGGLNVKRYYIWKQAQAQIQSKLWTDPRGYYFLNIVAVIPEAQGKGVSKKLMKIVIDQADAEGMACYLESSRDVPNIEIYGRFGFEFAEEMVCDDDGDAVKLFTMLRKPQGLKQDGMQPALQI